MSGLAAVTGGKNGAAAKCNVKNDMNERKKKNLGNRITLPNTQGAAAGIQEKLCGFRSVARSQKRKKKTCVKPVTPQESLACETTFSRGTVINAGAPGTGEGRNRK